MFARFPALFATISILACAGGHPVGLVIYLKAGAAETAALTEMKQDLTALMQSAGYSIHWLDASTIPDVRNAKLVVLELDGDCAARAATRTAAADIEIESLASTPVSDGQVLPFSTVHCDALNRAIGAASGKSPSDLGPSLYGRALARLAAHEIYHVLSNSREHSHDGVSKPCFSLHDLLTESFEFEPAALVKMRRGAPGEGASFSGAERDSGR